MVKYKLFVEMPIFNVNNTKVLFIHIPKNGGSSIEQSFSKICSPTLLNLGPLDFLKISPQHLTIQNLKELGHNVDYFAYSFSIVRNPYRRIESEYFYSIHKKHNNIDFSKFEIKHDNNKEIITEPFSEWVLRNLSCYLQNKHHEDNHFIPQSDFIDNSITEIFKFEIGITTILDVISSKLNISLEYEHKLKNNRTPVEWTDESIKLVNNIYRNDFLSFDYTML